MPERLWWSLHQGKKFAGNPPAPSWERVGETGPPLKVLNGASEADDGCGDPEGDSKLGLAAAPGGPWRVHGALGGSPRYTA